MNPLQYFQICKNVAKIQNISGIRLGMRLGFHEGLVLHKISVSATAWKPIHIGKQAVHFDACSISKVLESNLHIPYLDVV